LLVATKSSKASSAASVGFALSKSFFPVASGDTDAILILFSTFIAVELFEHEIQNLRQPFRPLEFEIALDLRLLPQALQFGVGRKAFS